MSASKVRVITKYSCNQNDSYFEKLERLDAPIKQELATDIIPYSLPDDYDAFIMNHNMHNLNKILTELHEMLKIAEQNVRKDPIPNVLMV